MARAPVGCNEPMTPDRLLEAFREQVRLGDADVVPGHVLEWDGPVRRSYPDDPATPGAVLESPLGLGADPDALIARQVEFFVGRGQRVEWKTYTDDEPADLGHRLAAAGFVPEADEAVVLGELHALTADPPLPGGVRVRMLDVAELDAGSGGPGDGLDPVRKLLEVVWGEGTRWMTDALAREWRDRPDLLDVAVAEVDPDDPATSGRPDGPGGPAGRGEDTALCAAWVRYAPGTDFAGMWGGATHPAWRRRGLYRAVLALRARAAIERGYRFARVDASPESEPVLTRLGLHRVSTTVPFVLEPG